MDKIQSRSKNPKGLHKRYKVSKANGNQVDIGAEYFVLRVDEKGKDPKHIAACRKALMVYAFEIQGHLPELAKDLRERYGEPVVEKVSSMVTRRPWKEFQSSKLLWWVNRSLHLLGWAICLDVDESGNVIDAYPSRVKFRGFDQDSESKNFIILSEHIRENADKLVEEAKD